MKKRTIILTFIVLSVSVQAVSLSHEEITNMIDKIKQERSGIQLERLETTPNPFALNQKVPVKINDVEEVEETKEEVVYKLTSIFNHKGFLNGKWYKEGDAVDNFTVSKIDSDSVTLVNGSVEKVVTLPKKKSFILYKGN